MNETRSAFSEGGLQAISACSTDPDRLWNGFFDLVVVGASWDRRCTAITTCAGISASVAVEIIPFVEELDPLLSGHHRVIREFCERRSREFHLIRSKPAELADSFAEIRKHLWAAIGHPGRAKPARVLIDVSTCPRYFSLAVLAEAFRSGLVCEIVVAYSEARYPDAVATYASLEDISYTDGAFQSVPVPGFYGEFEPKKGVYYLVSTGFDGWKTLNLLVRKDPDRVAALVASPGGSPDYVRRALVANGPMFERFGISEAQIIRATAGDAVEAWKRIAESSTEDFQGENIFYLCSGNKAHSVALALRALANEAAALLYNRPAQHLPNEVECSGVHWAYSISPTAGTVFGN